MKTIAAVDLRNNLDQVVKRVRNGESIRVTYRSKTAFIIHPDTADQAAPQPGSQTAMQEYVKAVRAINTVPRPSELDPTLPVKILYRKALDRDSKYKGHNAE